MKVSFLAPVAVGRRLECVARVISGGRSAAFVEAELADIGPGGDKPARRALRPRGGEGQLDLPVWRALSAGAARLRDEGLRDEGL